MYFFHFHFYFKCYYYNRGVSMEENKIEEKEVIKNSDKKK